MPQRTSDIDMTSSVKQDIHIDLQPICDMLRYNKRRLSFNEWLDFVEAVRRSIVHRPLEYIEKDVKSNDLDIIVNEIFDEFITNIRQKEDKQIRAYKRKFDRALRHIKALLLKQKNEMTAEQWKTLVFETRQAVLHNPDDFFYFELPVAEVTSVAIRQVFEGFLEDQKIRAAQSRRLL